MSEPAQHTPDHIWQAEHAAALLLLRELMHHLGFLTLLRAPPRQA
jgi:hypothetical protein